MKKLFPLLPILLVVLTACPSKKKVLDEDAPVISQFIYDGMSTYYLWANTISKRPTSADEKKPTDYFKNILYPLDTQHGWSWITDDVDELLAGFSGSPKDIGWSLALYRTSSSNRNVVGLVKYVFPNTPAFNANIKRSDVITGIDGAVLTLDNYQSLFDGNTHTFNIADPTTAATRSISLTPIIIQTNPVLKDTIYKNDPQFAGKKIGYVFYTDFIAEYNNKLYETFTKFKNEGITDLVVDLRYNHGGAIGAAAYLASLIAPQNVVATRSVFTILNYNDLINSAFDQSNGGDRKAYFINSGTQNPLNANLNFNKVYIIATDDSYSASELLTFCLKPYMDVIHIGNNTGGKFTGSWTLHAFDTYNGRTVPVYDDASDLTANEKNKLKNWAMQPIVAKYSDKNNNDFVNPGYLEPTYSMNVEAVESDPSLWKPIGDVNDYLLAKAISVITGIPVQSSIQMNTQKRSVYTIRKIANPTDRFKENLQLTPPQQKDIGRKLLLHLK